jgi:Predicted ATPase of the ABC class
MPHPAAPHPAPLLPLGDQPPAPRAELFATLARIDGWGQGAWREVYSCWRLRHALLTIDDLEAGVSRDQDDRVAAATLVLEDHALGDRCEDDDATCDWVLRQAWATLLPRLIVTATTHRPAATVHAVNACVLTGLRAGAPRALLLRLLVRLPMAGMCCDGRALAAMVRRLERFAAGLVVRRSRPGLAAHRACVTLQRRLRAALPAHGLVAFIGDGARLARDRDDRPARACRPLRAPPGLRTTIDLGPYGRHHGLGLRHGVTAIAGAPYHGKSTLLQAVIAGRYDHAPGDGRELVVADGSVVQVQAEDGRRIKDQDLSVFFATLPGGPSTAFTSERASGATSMAASVLQAVAAGCRLLAVDEDSAASNFLTIDPLMRRLLGATLTGTTTLLEVLPALARLGVSTVLVAGSSAQTLSCSDHILLLEHYRPSDARRRVRRLLPAVRRRWTPPVELAPPRRWLADQHDCLFGPRHFLTVDASEPERPRLGEAALDLRRSGWTLDTALVRGALAAAAWVCRLADAAPTDLATLHERYQRHLDAHGVRGLDPFDTALIAAPPWQLVVSVLERLARPRLTSRLRRRR